MHYLIAFFRSQTTINNCDELIDWYVSLITYIYTRLCLFGGFLDTPLNTFTLLDEIFGALKITKQWVVVGAVHHLLERVEFEDLLDLLIKLLLSLLSQRRRLLHHLGHQFLQNCIRLLFWNNVQLLLGLLLVMLVSLPFIGALTG